MYTPITSDQMIVHGGIAFFGAIVHALNAHRTGKSKGIIDFSILVIMASFTGVMFFIVASHFFEGQTWMVAASTGAGAYMGVDGMSLLVEKIRIVLIKK